MVPSLKFWGKIHAQTCVVMNDGDGVDTCGETSLTKADVASPTTSVVVSSLVVVLVVWVGTTLFVVMVVASVELISKSCWFGPGITCIGCFAYKPPLLVVSKIRIGANGLHVH